MQISFGWEIKSQHIFYLYAATFQKGLILNCSSKKSSKILGKVSLPFP